MCELIEAGTFNCDKATMCSVEYLRGFVSERLTAAAEEILGVFEKTIVEYEKEIDRQRRLLDIAWKPEVNLHRIELPQQDVCKVEEVVAEQQLCIEERKSSVEQEEPEGPEIKEEEEEVCSSQEGEQLEVKQETESFLVSPADEDQTLNLSIDEPQNVMEENLINYIFVNSSVTPELISDHYLLCHSSHGAESPDQEGDEQGDSTSTREAEPEQQGQRDKSNLSEFHPNTFVTCDICGKAFRFKSRLNIHLRIHTGEKPFACKVCGKSFRLNDHLKGHMKTHTGEKPYSCNICGKRFSQISSVNIHKRVHTGEKPFSCKTCGKDFRYKSHLIGHMRTHTGEKPFQCDMCGKAFTHSDYLKQHLKTHTGEKPYSCSTCGKRFYRTPDLKVHMRMHTGEKPCSCKICGKDFRRNSNLLVHMRIHTGEKPYSCKTCGKAFGSSYNLLVHVRRAHTGDKHTFARSAGKDTSMSLNWQSM